MHKRNSDVEKLNFHRTGDGRSLIELENYHKIATIRFKEILISEARKPILHCNKISRKEITV